MGAYTTRERRLMEGWPTVTEEDMERMNDLFHHYLFFRKRKLAGMEDVELWSSCCGRHEILPILRRTETPAHRELMADLVHKRIRNCPWCGKALTVISLSKAGKRKSLAKTELTVILHGTEDALYADAVVLHKSYDNEQDLAAKPTAWCSSGYRFAKGEVMQLNHQGYGDKPYISYEEGALHKKKRVQEPFKSGCIEWYKHESYSILNREVVTEHPFFKWCGYFDQWQYRPFGPRGYAHYFSDFISWLTIYSIYPRQMEMLLKFGLTEPISDMLDQRKKNAAAMCWEETDPRKAFGLNKQELSWFLAVRPGMNVLAIFRIVRDKLGKAWSLPMCYDFSNLWGGDRRDALEVLRTVRQYGLDIDKFLRYMDRCYLEHEDAKYLTLFELHRDYLDAAYHMGQCMTHSKVLYPPDLYAAHDDMTRRWAEAQETARNAKKAVSMRERRLKYEFEQDGLRIVFPATAGAIRAEGKALRHCVGGYADRHCEGVLSILFLRKADNPYTPYVTIEMLGNQIAQIHGWDDERTPCAANPTKMSYRTMHKEFLDTWLAWLKKGSPRNEDGTPKLSQKKKQIIEVA